MADTDYFAKAVSAIARIPAWYGERDQAAVAQVYATLAVANELRLTREQGLFITTGNDQLRVVTS